MEHKDPFAPEVFAAEMGYIEDRRLTHRAARGDDAEDGVLGQESLVDELTGIHMGALTDQVAALDHHVEVLASWDLSFQGDHGRPASGQRIEFCAGGDQQHILT